MSRQSPRIGLALGGGSARGGSHIGVIRLLERAAEFALPQPRDVPGA